MLTLFFILLNIVLSMIAFAAFRRNNEPERFLLIPYLVGQGGNRVGMVLSHFAHADIGHLMFNMITLYFFGPVVERGLGGMEFVVIYAAAGATATVFVYHLHKENPTYRALGASDSVSGIIFAAIVIEPRMNIFFFLVPIPIPAPVFAVGYIILSTLLMKRGLGNISHEAHIAGAATGLLLGGMLAPFGFDRLLDRIGELLG